jgi:transcriptional antiterminator RfaH
MEAWYALYTKPRQETTVAEQLEERGLQTFLPEYNERRRGKPPNARVLFPCYLFVRVDLEAAGLSVLRWTPGLRRIVSFGGAPAKMPDEAIALVGKRLAQVEARGGFLKPRFRPGERVRLREGPLAGLEAVFEGPVRPSERVRILISFLGEANRAVVPVDQLEAVAPRKHPPRRTRGRGRKIKR